MRRIFYLLVVLLVMVGFTSTAQTYKVVRGPRPPINLDKVPKDAYYPGILKIKFTQEMTKVLDEHGITRTKSGIVQFGIPSVDKLLRKYGVKYAKGVFDYPVFKNSKYKARHRAWGFHLWYRLEVDKSLDIKKLVREFEALPEVEYAEPEYKKVLYGMKTKKWTPNDPDYPQQWHYNNTGQSGGTVDADIDLPEAWDLEKGDTNVVVAVVDGGIQVDHPDLQANIWWKVGYNFVDSTTVLDPVDHGTHVSGTIAAVNNNGVGVSGVAGGSGSGDDGVRLLSCQVFTNSSAGGFEVAPVWAADQGAAISQNSWGYTQSGVYDQEVLDAIDYFNANGGGNVLDGGITIFAAGNDNDDGLLYPGCYENVVGVAATNDKDQKAWYSNYGDWVDIAAPGGETGAHDYEGILSTVTGGSYDWYQGTSMATPHVSGVAGLVISYAYQNGVVLTNQQVREILLNSTDYIDDLNPNYVGKLGTGRLNAYKALLYTQDLINGLTPPGNFVALPVDPSTIDLSWDLDSNGHDVMIVYSTSPIEGDPVDGQTYNVGDTIPGGATVIYKGNATTFTHSGLQESTTYFYKAYSYTSANDYSLGIETSAKTPCNLFTDFPLVEGFESGTLPDCWSVEGDNLWKFDVVGGLSGHPDTTHSGYYNARFFSSDADGILIMPVMDFTGVNNAVLKFWHAQAEWSGDQDTLVLVYKSNPSDDWQVIATYTDDIPEWTEEIVQLPNLSSYYQVGFLAKARYGYGIVLDDIMLVADQPFPPEVNVLSVTNLGQNSATINCSINNVSNVNIVQSGALVSTDPEAVLTSSGVIVETTDSPVQSGSYSVDFTSLTSHTNYYTRAFVVTDSDTVYSIAINFKTLCEALTTVPYTEDFESGQIPDCWLDLQGHWTLSDGGHSGHPGSAHSGSNNLLLYSSSDLRDTLLMPVFDLTNVQNPVLKFWHAQPAWAGDQDELTVLVRYGADQPWQSALYFNNDIQDWQLDSISLNSESFVQVAFAGFATYGYGVSIDDVSIEGQTVATNVDDKTNLIRLYPNPTVGFVNIVVPQAGFKLQIFDPAGRLVMSKNLSSTVNHVNLNLSSGIYIVKLYGQDVTYTGKLIVK